MAERIDVCVGSFLGGADLRILLIWVHHGLWISRRLLLWVARHLLLWVARHWLRRDHMCRLGGSLICDYDNIASVIFVVRTSAAT